MLTAIEIENFKAFGERQRIELRPITMLFGPNSGGKSSVVHALHYLREILCERNIDAHRTWSGGDALDLGGIRNFVHGRQTDGTIRLKAEFTLSGAEIPDYIDFEPDILEASEVVEERVRGLLTSASVEIDIDSSDAPMARSIRVGLNGAPFAELDLPRDKPNAEVRAVNWQHAILLRDDLEKESAGLDDQIAAMKKVLDTHQRANAATDEASIQSSFSIPEYAKVGHLAEYYEAVGGAAVTGTVIPVHLSPNSIPPLDQRLSVSIGGEGRNEDTLRFEILLSILLLGPVWVLQRRLESLRYVGPLRAMPTRHREPRDHASRSRWPSGLQAWETIAYEGGEVLQDGTKTLLEETSDWLESTERLDTGYRLELETSKLVPASVAAMVSDPEYIDRLEDLAQIIKALPEQTRVMLRDVGRNLPLQAQDVGVGLSQIVPILVALLEPKAPLVALEQPELHLHPRQQAALGDALICGMTAAPNRVLLIETHSEHLILRLLRRIKETTRKENKSGQALSPEMLRIQYIQREGTASRVQTIDVDVNGDMVDPWPDDFFEQDFKERFS